MWREAEREAVLIQMELSQRSLNSSRFFVFRFGRNWWEVAGWANWVTTLNQEAWDGFFSSLPTQVSKLRGLPAHLPRNLASFSPRVDDGNSGGSWPGRLSRHWWLLSSGRGGIWVLMVRFSSRWQRIYRVTCGRQRFLSAMNPMPVTLR